MPTYKDVEVWIEDSESRRLDYQEVTISLVDDRTVTVKTEMSKGELYTVHCLSPISVFCDVFVITASRKRAARFHLDKSLAISNASGSSANCTEGQYRDHGLRAPKRQLNHGNLGGVEVEIRRIGEIIKGEPREESEVDGGEEAAIELSMIDDFNRPPWIVFHFDIRVKESLAVPVTPTAAAENIKGRAPRRTVRNKSRTTNKSQPRISGTERSGDETSRKEGHECLRSPRKRPRRHDCDGSADVSEDLVGANSDRLHEEYQTEEAEERRLLQKLQERLQAKKARNMELRRLLGEMP